MKKKFIVIISLIIIAFTTLLLIIKPFKKQQTFGVWWWDDELSSNYLDFAKNNGINEIYYCSSKFNEETATFISNCNKINIKVYWLAGEYKWLNDSSNLISKIENYVTYQNNYPSSKFSGIHLDIEPHQDPLFSKSDTDRNLLITKLILIANNLKSSYPNVSFDYDLPFWLNDQVVFNSVSKPAYEHMIDVANRVFLMSYRDTAEAIYGVAKEEIEYAVKTNKNVILGVETKSDEGDNVSFMEEGKTIMNQEISKLKKLIPQNCGICIHQIKTWYELKD